MEQAKGRLHNNMLEVALGTGLRSGELRGLTWSDIDFRKREISVNKTLVYIKDMETKNICLSIKRRKQKTVYERFLCRRVYIKH